ncbi:MAG TPA: response regulator transcription factor, partial [Nitrolancea sp.]|nr:response regulator transcription factor [Nitrolancea sp.]
MSQAETHKRPIRVLIVDDHEMVRSGLAAFLGLAPDLELVGEAGSGEEAIRLCRELRPDVVLMDMVMPGIDGPEATRAIRAAHPETQVIVLTSFLEGDLVQHALQAG